MVKKRTDDDEEEGEDYIFIDVYNVFIICLSVFLHIYIW